MKTDAASASPDALTFESPFPALQARERVTLRACARVLVNIRWWLGLPPVTHRKSVPTYPLIKVLIPAHNEEAHIEQTVRSVLRQVHVYQVVIINDGSTDKTGAIADQLAHDHPHNVVVLHRAKATGHKAGALNAALNEPSIRCTPVIAVIDADTTLHESTFARMLPHFYDPHVAGVGARVVAGPAHDGNASYGYRAKVGENHIAHLLAKPAQSHVRCIIVTAGCCSIFRTEVLTHYECVAAEDMELSMRLSKTYDLSYEEFPCFSAEPPNLKTFIKQRRRWIEGFLQCYRLHILHGDMWKNNFKLWCMAHHMFISGLMGLPILFLLMITGAHAVLPWAFQSTFGVEPHAAVLWGLAILSPIVLNLLVLTTALFISEVVFAHEEGRSRSVSKVLTTIIPTFVGGFIIQGVFWHSVWKVFFTSKQDTVWNKGH